MLVKRHQLEGRILYIKGHKESLNQAKGALESFENNGFSKVSLREGVTPKTLDRSNFDFPILKNGRLDSFRKNTKKFLTKLSCLHNTLSFCTEVVENNKPMLSAEHDCISKTSFDQIQVTDFCFLNYDTAFQYTCLNKKKFKKYKSYSHTGINFFPNNYPLTYKYKTMYEGAVLPPGLAGYILTPTGARKILNAVYKNGLEQCDLLINSYVLKLEYIHPSICTYNPINLQTSHGF